LVFGITGDCPALSLVCNFINHNGYFSCWYCFIKGQHINHKRQYRYGSINLRTTEQYLKASKKAERTKTNVYGHLGKSILLSILDVPLPNGICWIIYMLLCWGMPKESYYPFIVN